MTDPHLDPAHVPASTTPTSDGPKEVAAPHYGTTPPEDRVGAADRAKHEPVVLPSVKEEVTGKFDHLATRDPAEMERAAQAPDQAGLESGESTEVLGAGSAALGQIAPGGDRATTGAAALGDHLDPAADPNPGYTPPSQGTVPDPGQPSGDDQDGLKRR